MRRNSFSSFFSLKIAAGVKKSVYAAIIITASIFVITTVLLIFIQPELPIFYSLPQPKQQLANKLWLLLFPAISISITCTHLLIIKFLRPLDKLVLKLFIWSTVMVQVLLALSLLRIIIIIS